MRWRIERITPDTQRIAQAAARAAGLSTAGWLERAIRNATEGLEPQQRTPSQTSLPLSAASAPAPSPITTDIPMAIRDDGDWPSAASAQPVATAPAMQTPPHPTASAADTATIEGSTKTGTPAADVTPDPAAEAPTSLPPTRHGRTSLFAGIAAAIIAAILGVAAWWLWPQHSHDNEQHSVATQSDERRGTAGTAPPDSAEAQPDKPEPDASPAPSTPEEAMAALQHHAAAGNPMAQHDLALAYVGGHGVPQNYAIAAEWFEKAAAGGSERAQFNLAVLYENALGVPQDFARAFANYLAAAERGFPPAQHNVGVAYARGRGTAVDYRAATLWFRRAADHGIAPAQFNLGMIYEQGLAGPPDPETALGWYRRAAAGGSAEALARLTIMEGRVPPPATAGNGKPAKLTAAEVAEVQALLTRLAFKPGPTDGKVGRGTRDAIRDYQRVAGLTVTGEATADLLEHLRQVVGMMDASQR